jgi:spore germination protein KC
MRKRIAVAVMILLAAALTGGCWNYRGLNEMAITSGVAVDFDEETGLYHMSFEVVDLTGPVKYQGVKAMLLESYGTTMFDAVRNAKKRIVNKIYFGHMELVVFSQNLVSNTDMSTLIDFFLRDAECRETICVAISQEKTAKDLLNIEGIGQPMVAFEICKIIQEDQKITSSTESEEIYEVYDILNSPGVELALPAFRNTFNDGEPASEANGIAVFKNQRLVGYLTPEESKYYLFAKDKVNGGVITCSSKGDGPEDTTLEISESTTKVSFDYKDGKMNFNVETETTAYLDEMDEPMNALDEQTIQAVEASASRKLVQGISDVIQRVRTEYDSDIFGFGNMVYKQDNKLWQQLKDNWDNVFATLAVNISCKVHIANTASFKKS